MFVRNVLDAVIDLRKCPAAPDIAAWGEVAVLVDADIPPVCLIVDIVNQFLRHRDGPELLEI